MPRLAALLFVLASTYLVGRLAVGVAVYGAVRLDAEVIAHVVAVPLAQLAAVEAARSVRRLARGTRA